jgi:hypothetical protein
VATKEAPPADTQEEAPAWAKGLFDRMDRMETEAREARARTASFKPMERPTNGTPTGIFAGMRPTPGNPAERDGVSKQILVDERGNKVPEMLLRQYPPRFGVGDPCRIDPHSTRPGFPEGRTWGDVLAERKLDGVGVIRKVYWLRDTGEWKYSAVIRGITNQRPDGFLDSELLTA